MSKNKKKQRSQHRADLRSVEGKLMRDEIASLQRAHKNDMTGDCRKACMSLLLPSQDRLDEAYCDATHLGDVQQVEIVRTILRGNLEKQANKWTFLQVNSRAIASDATVAVASGPSSTLTSFMGGGANVSGNACKAFAPGYNSWTRAQVFDEDVNLAYVASELRIYNTSQEFHRDGRAYAYCVPLGASNEVDGRSTTASTPLSFDDMASHPDTRVMAGALDVRMFHMADVVEKIPYESVPTADPDQPGYRTITPYTSSANGEAPYNPNFVFLHWGNVTNKNVHTFELTVYHYAFGRLTNAAAELHRVPKLWNCLRNATGVNAWQPSFATRASLDKTAYSWARATANSAVAWMKSNLPPLEVAAETMVKYLPKLLAL